MNPTISPHVSDVANVSRKVLCSNYSRCLEVALVRRWPGFSCSQCASYELESADDVEHWEEQARRCRKLLLRLYASKPNRKRPPMILPRERVDFPMSEQELFESHTEARGQDSLEHETIRLPQAFLAPLMLLLENRPPE